MRKELRWLLASVLPVALSCGSSVEPSASRGADDDAVEPGDASVAAGPEPVGSALGGDDEGPAGGAGAPAGAGGMGGSAAPSPGGGSGGGGALGSAGGDAGAPVAESLPIELDGAPEHYRYVRLTHEQWENSVQDNLRLDGPTGWLDGLAPDVRSSRYSNDENALEVGPMLVVDYAEAAEVLAERVATEPARLAAAYAGTDADGFVAEVGRRFYRRPLTTDEATRLEAVFATGAGLQTASDEFSGGARLVLELLLQAPHFLYRIEAGPSRERLNGYELATKLAYFITNSTPSDALLEAAGSGALDTDDGVRAAAEELLDTDRAKATLRRFHGETFAFPTLREIAKDPALGYVDGTNAALEEASYLFFERIFEQSLGVRDIFLDDVGYVSSELAALYGAPGADGAGFVDVRLGAERPGYFTQLPFLILYSRDATPDSIHRGMVLNNDVLCAGIPEHPAASDAPTAAGGTNRERVTAATSGAGCESCHREFIDPLGFAFENFDGLGRLREEDNGAPVDTTGSYPFVEGRQSFDGAPALMQLLAESAQAHACYASHLAAFGLARELGPDDAPVVDALRAKSQTDAASLRELVLALVTSPAFCTRQGAP